MQTSATGISTDPTPQARLTNMAPIPNAPLAQKAHRPGPRHAAGFSLLEVLVVVFIIGILATMFTLSVGVLGADPELEKEVDRLHALIDLAREDAVINGRELGVHFYPDSYEFATFQEDFIDYYDPDDEVQDQSEWIVLNPGTLLKPRRLPAGIVIELEIDGRQIVLDEKKAAAGDDPDNATNMAASGTGNSAAYRPQIWLYSTGDMNPFVIRFRRTFDNDSLILEFSDDGSVELSEG